MPDDFVTLRAFEKLESKVEEMVRKHGEDREQLRDIRALLIAMLVVCAPNLVTGLMTLLGKH